MDRYNDYNDQQLGRATRLNKQSNVLAEEKLDALAQAQQMQQAQMQAQQPRGLVGTMDQQQGAQQDQMMIEATQEAYTQLKTMQQAGADPQDVKGFYASLPPELQQGVQQIAQMEQQQEQAMAQQQMTQPTVQRGDASGATAYATNLLQQG